MDQLEKDICRAIEEKNLRRIMESAENEIANHNKVHFRSTRITRWACSIAASLVVILSLPYMYASYIVCPQVASPHMILSEDAIPGMFRGDDNDQYMELMREFEDSANHERYDEALKTLDAASELTDCPELIQYNRALIYVRQGKYFKAKKILKVIANDDNELSSKAKGMLEELRLF